MNVLVEGRLSIRSYETKEGEKRKATEVVCSDMQMLDSKRDSAGGSGGGGGYGGERPASGGGMGREEDVDGRRDSVLVRSRRFSVLTILGLSLFANFEEQERLESRGALFYCCDACRTDRSPTSAQVRAAVSLA